MRKPEQRLWDNKVRPALKSMRDLTFDRLEPGRGSASGVPDVIYTYGKTGFLELKASDRKNGVGLADWRQDQRIWTRKHMKRGATVFLVIGTPHGVYLVDPWPNLYAEYTAHPHSVLGEWGDPQQMERLFVI